MYLFQPKVEICRFLRLMQFVLQLSGHGETWSFKIWHFEMFEMWVARSSNNKTNNKKRCSWRFLCKWLNINVFVVFCICCCHVPGLKGRSVLPSSQAILVTVQVVNCSSRHWNAEVLKYVWSILMTNLGLSWRDAMPLVGSSMPPEGGAGRWVLKIWVSRHPNLNWRHLWSESQGHYWSLEKKRALI